MAALTGYPRCKQRETRFNLTPRDVALLQYLSKNRFATINDIKRLFWGNRENRHYYRRLYTLRDQGLVSPLLGDNGITLGYRLSKNAVRDMKFQGIIDRNTKTFPNYRSAFDHDKKLLRIREIFESSPLVSEFQPEHLVRSELAIKYGREEKREDGYKVPDALFKLKTPKGVLRVALELECSRKSLRRYRLLVRALATTPDADLIFVVCDYSQIMLCIKNMLNEGRAKDPLIRISKKDNGFYFTSTENLLKDGLNAIFDGEGKQFSFTSLQKKNEEAALDSLSTVNDNPQTKMANASPILHSKKIKTKDS